MRNTTYHGAAEAFLASDAIVAWEPSARERSIAMLDAFVSGRLDMPAMRAALAGGIGRSSEPRPRGVRVLSLSGVLTPDSSIFTLLGGGTSLRAFVGELNAAVLDKSISSIVVRVDSPGGLVGMVPEASAAMRAARARKRVTVAVAGLNASAAYWVTAGASELFATPSALIGSIGVYTIRASVARQLEREGVDVEVFSAGRFKTEGLPVLPNTDTERRATRARVEEAYSDFVSDVARGRRTSTSAVQAGYGEGRAVSAREALRLGMIDGIVTVDDVITRAVTALPGARAMATIAGIEAASEADRRRRLERF